MAFRAYIAKVVAGQDLTRNEARQAMADIMEGVATPAQIGAFLVALRMKGESPQEIAGAALAMRARAHRIPTQRRPLLDTCGTGGDGQATVNISTATAFVAAGAGVAVAKHGNRSVSSRSGSADVLEALGVRLDLGPRELGQCLDEVGLAFLFAPRLHPAMRHAIGPRREIGIRTFFNILGPLTNPAGADRQVLGVYSPELVEPLANVLAALGVTRAIVFHGAGGLDELSLAGPNLLYEVRRTWKSPQKRSLDGARLGLPRAAVSALRGGTPQENAAWLRDLLAGRVQGPTRDTVLLNAAAALVTADATPDIREALEMARDSLESGKARDVLDRLVAFTQDHRPGLR
jgi:anthranilate phosphoribosyltransferase